MEDFFKKGIILIFLIEEQQIQAVWIEDMEKKSKEEKEEKYAKSVKSEF